MSIPEIREQKYFHILRNACLLTIFVLCESVQLMFGAIWFLNSRPLASVWASRVSPEGLSFILPERETLFFHLMIVFTYIDDITLGTTQGLKNVGYKIINLGGNQPYDLISVIKLIEDLLGKKASVKNLTVHKTDMLATWANIGEAEKILGWKPQIELKEGLRRTVDWYLANKHWLTKIQ